MTCWAVRVILLLKLLQWDSVGRWGWRISTSCYGYHINLEYIYNLLLCLILNSFLNTHQVSTIYKLALKSIHTCTHAHKCCCRWYTLNIHCSEKRVWLGICGHPLIGKNKIPARIIASVHTWLFELQQSRRHYLYSPSTHTHTHAHIVGSDSTVEHMRTNTQLLLHQQDLKAVMVKLAFV